MVSNKSGWTMMSSSNESGQTRPASNKSGRRTHWEQAADKVSKQQERDGYSAAAAMTTTIMTCLNNNQQTTGVGGGREEEDCKDVSRSRRGCNKGGGIMGAP
jgi:hypothetical protein